MSCQFAFCFVYGPFIDSQAEHMDPAQTNRRSRENGFSVKVNLICVRRLTESVAQCMISICACIVFW